MVADIGLPHFTSWKTSSHSIRDEWAGIGLHYSPTLPLISVATMISTYIFQALNLHWMYVEIATEFRCLNFVVEVPVQYHPQN